MTPTSPQNPNIAVFGASGHTGRFVISQLLKRGLKPIAIGRSVAKLATAGFQESNLTMRTASIEDPNSLDRALAGAAAVINCAGPFLDTAGAVAAAALHNRIHYLDISAEQASAQASFDHFHDAAKNAGVLVIPAMGFYGGFIDLLATAAMDDWEAVDEIWIGIALDSWHPTAGTRITGKRNNVQRLIMEDGKLAPLTPAAESICWDFPEPFGRQDVTSVPFSEVPLLARHAHVKRLRTYLNNAPLRDLRDTATPPPVAEDESGQSAQIFLVDVVVRNGNETRRAIARGRDIYAFTAPLIVEAAQRILDGRSKGSGALAPGTVFNPHDFLQSLTPEYLTFELSGE